MRKETIELTAENLKKNNFRVTLLEKKEEVVPYLKSVMKIRESVAVGGSESLKETGVLDLLRNGDYKFYDRYQEGIDIQKVFHESFSATYYLAGANAITESGLIYNVDGTGNRTACITYGPQHVFLVVSTKKIVRNLNEAALRVKEIVAPLNCKRLQIPTPCAKLGHCIKDEIDDDLWMANGQVYCPSTICASVHIMSRQRVKDRIEVILVDDDFGY
jgi:Uncharacterised ACR, YkgG family COG1556.